MKRPVVALLLVVGSVLAPVGIGFGWSERSDDFDYGWTLWSNGWRRRRGGVRGRASLRFRNGGHFLLRDTPDVFVRETEGFLATP
jgi:hypothetical protein